MFQRSSVIPVALLMALSTSVSATNYLIGTRADTVEVDGLCSVREAFMAINGQRGYIGPHRADQSGVTLPGGVTFKKEVRNVSSSGQFVIAGERVPVRRGQQLEYRITVTAPEGDGDVAGVTLSFNFPHQEFPGWRSYLSEYVAGSTTLNGSAVADAGGQFPLSGAFTIQSQDPDENTPVPAGTILDGTSAEVTFRVTVRAGPNEAVSDDLPEVTDVSKAEYLAEAECAAGTISNIIQLKTVAKDSDEDAVVYQLDLGQLTLEGEDVPGGRVNPSVTIQPRNEGPFDRAEKKSIQIRASAGERVFEVARSATLSMTGVTLTGNGDLAPGEHGGLIVVRDQANLDISGKSLLEHGSAQIGGAIYANTTGGISLQEVGVENNTAVDSGGAFGSGPDFSGLLLAGEFHFIGNRVTGSGDGGAIHIDGTTPSLILQNGTFYDNEARDGSAIRIEAADAATVINNVTVAGNTAEAGFAALSYRVVDDGEFRDAMWNSAIVGNLAGSDPGAPDATGDCRADDADTFDRAEFWYVVSGDQSCSAQGVLDPLEQLQVEYVAADGEHGCTAAAGCVFDYGFATFNLLKGVEACGELPGPASCEPREFAGGLKGFLPNTTPFPIPAPVPAADTILPFLVGSASPEDAISNVCAAKDQRGLNRDSRCDSGAVQLQVAIGTNSEFILIQGRQAYLDVLMNDLGDLTVSCLDQFGQPDSSCMGFYLQPRHAAVATQISVSDVDRTMAVHPDRKGVYFDRAPTGDEEEVIVAAGYPLISYTPSGEFHGVDQFIYFIRRSAIDGPVYANTDVSARSNLVVEPPSGLASSSNGSMPLMGLAALLVLGLRRAVTRTALLSLAALLLSVKAVAADIIVNTAEDFHYACEGNLNPADPVCGSVPRDLKVLQEFQSNRRCSLREALWASIDRSPFFTPDCAPGATGRDRIFIDLEGTVELQAPLSVFNSVVDIEGRGPGITIISGRGLHRIIEAQSSVTLRNLTIEDGFAQGNGGAIFTNSNLVLENVEIRNSQATGSGGAIYLNYGSERGRQMVSRRSYAHGNFANVSGGFLSMVGQNQRHDIVIDASTFESNAARVDGGGLDINLPAGGSLRIINSTFVDHDSAFAGANPTASTAIDLKQMASSTTAYILNSTIVDRRVTPSGNGIELGGNTGRVFFSHSIYAGFDGCGAGVSDPDVAPVQGDPRDRFEESYYNVYSGPQPASCRPILGGNVANKDQHTFAEISDVLNDFELTDPEFSFGVYIPPHFPILALAAVDQNQYPAGVGVIIDSGNTGLSQSRSDSAPRACRAQDLRGKSRESGASCDIGAYELEVPTAIDDSADNRRRVDREVRVNVLHNDIAGDAVGGGVSGSNTILRGSIDLDPLEECEDPKVGNVAGECIIEPVPGEDWRFRLTRVPNGTWEIDIGESLPEGKYQLIAVVRNSVEAFVTSVQQTVIVRSTGLREDLDVFNDSDSGVLVIAALEGDIEGDFVVADGRLRVSGTSTAEQGSVIELFVDGRFVGEAPLQVSDAACGGEPGFPGDDQSCIVRVEPLTALECDAIEGGLELTFPYRFAASPGSGLPEIYSNVAEMTATITNLPPRFKGQVRHSQPGRTETFYLDVVDPDGASPDIELDRFDIKTVPGFAKSVFRSVITEQGSEVKQVVFGIEGIGAIYPGADPVSGTDGLGLLMRRVGDRIAVTYTPRDNRGTFNDRFVLSYKDECGAEASAEFRVIYPPNEGSAGSLGWLPFLLLVVGLRRRR